MKSPANISQIFGDDEESKESVESEQQIENDIMQVQFTDTFSENSRRRSKRAAKETNQQSLSLNLSELNRASI